MDRETTHRPVAADDAHKLRIDVDNEGHLVVPDPVRSILRMHGGLVLSVEPYKGSVEARLQVDPEAAARILTLISPADEPEISDEELDALLEVAREEVFRHFYGTRQHP